MKQRMTKDGTVRSAGSNRRDFLKASALVAGYGVWVANKSDQFAFGQEAANEKVNVAWVGVGGKGDSDTSQVAQYANLIGICDTNDKNTDKKEAEMKNAGKSVKRYSDWRKMFDEIGKEVDAIGVSIPDHSHAIVSMHAMKMGKAVYCQKPLTHTLAEARAVKLAAREHKVVTQMGNQGTASNGLRTGVEVIRSGLLGKIKEVHVWTNRPSGYWTQAPEVMDWPKGEETPSTINWDVWTGPAPEHPYHHTYASFNWRGFWDYGTGAMGDMGCHTINMPFMALNLEHPTAVKSLCADLNPVTYPAWATVIYDFPARGDQPPIKLYWYEGHFDRPRKLKNLPPLALFGKERPSQSGSLTVGEKGSLYSPQDYGGNWKVLSDDKAIAIEFPSRGNSTVFPAQTLPRFTPTRNPATGRMTGDDDHQKLEWVNAIKGKGKTTANFDYASLLVETIHLGNIGNRVPGQPLFWDGPNMKITNDENANKFLAMEYREGWSL